MGDIVEDFLADVALRLRAQPFTLPVFAVSLTVLIAVFVLRRRAGKRFPAQTLLFLIAVAGFLAVTVTPDGAIITPGMPLNTLRWCYVNAGDVFPGRALTSGAPDRLLNVLIGFPLGSFAVPWRPQVVRAARGWWAVPVALLLPVAVEFFQWLLPQLGRACQSPDVGDNITGVLLGLLVGAVVAAVMGTRRKPPDTTPDTTPRT